MIPATSFSVSRRPHSFNFAEARWSLRPSMDTVRLVANVPAISLNSKQGARVLYIGNSCPGWSMGPDLLYIASSVLNVGDEARAIGEDELPYPVQASLLEPLAARAGLEVKTKKFYTLYPMSVPYVNEASTLLEELAGRIEPKSRDIPDPPKGFSDWFLSK